MSKRNEYDEIYLKSDNFGMEYIYKNHRLGGERIIPSEELSKIGAFKCNDDRIVKIITSDKVINKLKEREV